MKVPHMVDPPTIRVTGLLNGSLLLTHPSLCMYELDLCMARSATLTYRPAAMIFHRPYLPRTRCIYTYLFKPDNGRRIERDISGKGSV
jgi:hypothetical protein